MFTKIHRYIFIHQEKVSAENCTWIPTVGGILYPVQNYSLSTAVLSAAKNLLCARYFRRHLTSCVAFIVRTKRKHQRKDKIKHTKISIRVFLRSHSTPKGFLSKKMLLRRFAISFVFPAEAVGKEITRHGRCRRFGVV